VSPGRTERQRSGARGGSLTNLGDAIARCRTAGDSGAAAATHAARAPSSVGPALCVNSGQPGAVTSQAHSVWTPRQIPMSYNVG